MPATYLETMLPMRFHEFPQRVIVSVADELQLFLYKTGLSINSQEHHEVTRQVFDVIDFGFEEFHMTMNNLPIFKLLSSFTVDSLKYTDMNGSLNGLGLNLKSAAKAYGLSIYMTCTKVGIFDGGKTPYILEAVENDLLVLHNGFSNYKQ